MSDQPLSPQDAAAIARRAIPLLDLTDLGDACGASAVDDLCRTAREAGAAAVCVWPQFVAQAVRRLRDGKVRVATVINFPAGGEDVERAVEDTCEALGDGAEEIDLVLPYAAFLRGEEGLARDLIAAVRDTCDRGRVLKVILETGALGDPEKIARASHLSLEAGADFLKTSTGKSAVSATPEAALAMLVAIRDRRTERAVGLKVSGGLRKVADAATYLALADRIMGPDWANPDTFRIGASSLYGELAKAIGPAR